MRRLLRSPAAARLLEAARRFSAAGARASPPASSPTAGFTYDGNYNHIWHRKLGSKVGAVLIGQAAILLGLSNSSAFAQEESVNRAYTTSDQAEGNGTGLQRIEDGSVISNEHTVKWRIFTDNARDFFMKATRQLDEAEKLFQAALQEAKDGFGVRDPHVASALNNLAEFYRLRKECDKAEQLYLEAIEILEESFGSDDIRIGTALHSLGMCYHLQHKLTQAQICYERALKIEGRVMGVGHPEYASTMYLLAKVLSLQGKGKDAVSLIEESVRILEEAGLGESPTCIQRMKTLSTELIKLKRLAEAENWQRKILHILELSKGWDSLATTDAAETLSFTLQALGKLIESEELLERSLAVRKKILREDHFLVAGTLVNLARLSLLKFISDLENVNNDLARSNLIKGKQIIDSSIRITEGVLKSSWKDLNKLNSTSTTDMDKIVAAAILLQALEVVGLLEMGAKHMLPPGLVLFLRLPLEHMKNGSFKIDAVSISDSCRLFIWPDTNFINVRNTTLRIHFKNMFGKEQDHGRIEQAQQDHRRIEQAQQDHRRIEQALHKCISLYKEPHTRSLVSNAIKLEYLRCLRSLIGMVEDMPQTMVLQELLGDAQLIVEELIGKSNS
ncbi:hypothetical protein ACP70R_027024 [Stipagrostis hirtigluma subsp. patula]